MTGAYQIYSYGARGGSDQMDHGRLPVRERAEARCREIIAAGHRRSAHVMRLPDAKIIYHYDHTDLRETRKLNIHVLRVPADATQPIALRTIDNGAWETMQKLVGGSFEQHNFGQRADRTLIANAHSLYGAPRNSRVTEFMAAQGDTNQGCGFYGDIFFTGLDGASYVSVPDDVIAALTGAPA